ncbi:hypothetical protein [Paraferrimonas haliotis]|uniref:Uncharacterized protein n=1 Tax=Paraferrimonas haliotis TaxID=2013866 RepID=A0AA37WX54_9GAMM|nr:hypothetical protein [Paraferrimonas haliotis]GLS84258.1 hypothetical protein GCM10007894_22350 [Paraferrimonas haliotis]
MKKLLIIVASVLASLGVVYFVYTTDTPEIRVVNLTQHSVEQVIVNLPSSRVSFSDIPSQSNVSIFYSKIQVPGQYHYLITLNQGQQLSGRCGRVRPHELGKLLTLIVEQDGQVTCKESSKL